MAVVAELEAIITADTSGFDSGIADANNQLQSLGQSAGKTGQTMQQTGAQFQAAGGLFEAAGAAITAPLIGAVKQAADFQFAMDGVNAALGGMDTSTMDQLSQQAMDLGASSKFSATEVAGVQEQLGKMGLSAQQLLGDDGLGGATKAVIDLAAATGEGLAPSADAAAAAIQSFGLPVSDASRVADVLTGSLNNSSMSIQDMQRGLTYLGPKVGQLAHYTDMSAQGLDGQLQALIDTNAVLDVFSQRGLKAANTGVSFARMIDELASPTSDAADAMAKWGINAYDANNNMLPLPDLIDNIGKSLSGLSDKDRQQAISDIFGKQSQDVVEQMVKAFGQGGLGDEIRKTAEDISQEGIAAQQAAIRQNNLLGSVEKLGGAVNDLGIAMGTPLLDPLQQGTNKVADLASAAAGADPNIIKMVDTVGLLTGGMLSFGGAGLFGIGTLLRLGSAFGTAGLSLPLFAGGLLAATAGMALLGAAYQSNFLGFGDFVDEQMKKATEALGVFDNGFRTTFAQDKAAGMNDLAAAIHSFGKALYYASGGSIDLTDQLGNLSHAAQAFGDTAQRDLAQGQGLMQTLFDSLESAARAGGANDLADTFNKLAQVSRVMGNSMADTAGKMPLLNRVMSALTAGAQELTGLPLVDFFDKLGRGIDDTRNTLGDFRDQIAQGNIPSALADLFNAPQIEQGFNSFGAMLRDASNGFGDFKDDIQRMDPKAVFADIGGAFDALGTKIGETGIGTKLQGVSDDLQHWFQDVSTNLLGGVQDLQAGLGGTGVAKVTGAIPQLASDIGDALGHLPDMIGQKLKEIGNPFDAVGDWLQQGVQGISTDLTGGAMQAGLGGTGVDTGELDKLVTGITDNLGKMPDMVKQKLSSLPNPFEAVGQWLQDGLQQVGEFFTGDQAQAGLGGTGVTTSGISQMFDGVVQGISSGMDDAIAQLGAMKDEKVAGFQQAIGDLFGPIGQFLFPSGDAQAAGTQTLGDPAALGKQFGTSLVNTFKDPKFAESLDKAVTSLPPETFQGTAGALLDAINTGMGTALTTAQPATADKAATAPIGEQMMQTLATGLTTGLQSKSATDAFIPVANALGSTLNTVFGQAMTATLTQKDQTGAVGQEAGGGIGAQLVQSLADGLTTSFQAKGASDKFIPAVNALGTVLNTAMQTSSQQAQQQSGDQNQAGQLAGQGFGDQLVAGLAQGLTNSITAAKPETFLPVTSALGTQLGAAMQAAQTQIQPPGGTGPAQPQLAGFGDQMVQGLATGLTAGITAAKPEIFLPVTSALGTQLSAAMQAAQQTQVQPPGGVGPQQPQLAAFGDQMVQGLATGLTDSITAAKPDLFVPVSNALGTQLGAAMSMAAQQTQAPGPTGVPTTVPGAGQGMVEGLAQGLTDSITATPAETFQPVANALGAQLNTALQTVMTQTTGVGTGGGPVGADAAGGIGTQLVSSLASGLADSITAAPIEDFSPVGTALGSKVSEALQAAVQTAAAPPGGVGPTLDTSGIGAQLGQSVSQMMVSGVDQADFSQVGTSISTKLGEALQTAVTDTGDVGSQIGDSISQMLESAVSSADFSSVGDELATQLGDALTSAMDDVSSKIDDAMSQLTDSISQAMSGIGDAISSATDAVSSAVDSMSSSVADATSAVSDAVSQMQSAVEDAASSMEDAASSAADAASQIGSAASDAASAVESAMSSMAASVSAAAGTIAGAAGQIVAALNSIVAAAGAASGAVGSALNAAASLPASGGGGAAPAGTAATEGFAQGMVSSQGLITDASSQLATTAVTSLADAIGAHSPATKFMPVGASAMDGFLQGMLQQAKSRLQSAMGKIASAVPSAMSKIQSAIQSAMQRVHGQAQQQAATAGSDAGTALGTGMASQDKQAERAAARLWRKALKELTKGEGPARFLGADWARNFWEGMLDSSGTLEFAQYVTAQMVAAAENGVQAAMEAVKGLATQLDIVGKTVDSLTSDIADLQGQLDQMNQADAKAAQDAKLQAAKDELTAQKAITSELQSQFKTQFDAAHQAHIRAVQEGTVAAELDYENKLRIAQATDTAIKESQIKETTLANTLAAMQKAIEDAATAELAARRKEIEDELALKKQQLLDEQALQQKLLQQQFQAQEDYARQTLDQANTHLDKLKQQLRQETDPQAKAELKAKIALEQQRVDLANQLLVVLANGLQAGTPEGMAEANAQVQYLTEQLTALGDVDVSAMLQTIVSEMGTAASGLSTAATDLNSAASSLASTDTSGMSQAASDVSSVGTAASGAVGGLQSMGDAYNQVMQKMNADGQAFQAQFQAMVQKTQGDAATGGENIGTALSDGITGKISQGAPAMQKTMLDGIQAGVDQTDQAAGDGGTKIADTFGQSMRDKLGVKLPPVYQSITDGMKTAATNTTQAADQGAKDVGATYSGTLRDQLDKQASGYQGKMDQGVSKGLHDATQTATQGGHDVGDAMSTGIAKGVNDRARDIAQTAAQMVRDAVQAAHDAAGAHSPSRKMRALGHDMGDGLILGMGDRQADAEDASRRLVYIPKAPSPSDGGSGGRAAPGGGSSTTIHIGQLTLPDVTNPREFVAAMTTFSQQNGVASGRG